MKDFLGTIKQLKHVEPDKAYLSCSKKKLFSHITPPTHLNVSFLALTSSVGLCGLLVFFALNGTPTPPTPLASLDSATLTQEFNEIDLTSKIAETKEQDSNNRAIDRAIQNLAYTGKPTPKDIVIPKETDDRVNQLLDEIL
mgnify:FL=1